MLPKLVFFEFSLEQRIPCLQLLRCNKNDSPSVSSFTRPVRSFPLESIERSAKVDKSEEI